MIEEAQSDHAKELRKFGPKTPARDAALREENEKIAQWRALSKLGQMDPRLVLARALSKKPVKAEDRRTWEKFGQRIIDSARTDTRFDGKTDSEVVEKILEERSSSNAAALNSTGIPFPLAARPD